MSAFGDDEQEGTFSIFFAEGEVLAKQGQYKKAVESFTKALGFQPEDKSCLVARSKCYLQLGESSAALQDAEASLKEDKKYHKGLYQKAEVLYSMGDFEYALMFYHRGHKIRPELHEFTLGIQKAQEAINNSIGKRIGSPQLHEFTLGIQKAQEAINNSIGTPAACKLEKIGDLSFFQQQDAISKKKGRKLQKPGAKAAQQKARRDQQPVASEKTTKEMLGELYSDQEYLEKLLKDPGLVLGRKDHSIYNTVEEALSYLDARTEFWRQQKPMYTRKREKEMKKYKPSPTQPNTKRAGGADHTKFVLKSLEEIDNALAIGNAEESLKQAEQVMKKVQSFLNEDLPNKLELVASLHSCIGNAQLELGEAEEALAHHMQDLKIAEEKQLADAHSRALDNIGRVYSVMGQFQKAAEFWEQRVPMVKTSEEGTWLFHELGRCYLELGEPSKAKDYGEKALASARDAEDKMWQLNANVLVAQAETNLGQLQPAVQSFEDSLVLARLLDDEASQLAIQKALEALNTRTEQPGEEGTDSSTTPKS